MSSIIPIIDFRHAHSVYGKEEDQLASEINRALHEFGFLYLKNHGIPDDLCVDLYQCSREFFFLPEDQKLKWRMENSGIHWRGYFPVGAELTSGKPDQKEGLYFGEECPHSDPRVQKKLPMHGPNQWPTPEIKNLVLAYMQHCQTLSQRLLSLIGHGLGVGSHYFSERFTKQPTQLFRIFAYPPCKSVDAADQWGVREHTDMGFLTLLLQDHLGGLQVKTHKGWVDAPPIKDTLVVNIGDMLELWTWGKLKATLHRVRNTSKDLRLSFPYFFDPAWNATLERLPQEIFLEQETLAPDQNAELRWDKLDLQKISRETTYGDFVWAKISKVFPYLVPRESKQDQNSTSR